eukprot:6705741-Prorocentrum_lima.AAC.1
MSIDDDKVLTMCGKRLGRTLLNQQARIPLEDVERHLNIHNMISNHAHNPVLAQASDWTSSLGGAHA